MRDDPDFLELLHERNQLRAEVRKLRRHAAAFETRLETMKLLYAEADRKQRLLTERLHDLGEGP